MASESSSAVLDMNDADNEDTEAPSSVTEDAGDGIPLIMEHGHDIAVKVDAPMKQLSTLETFVTYRVRCVCARWPTPPYVRRRYNHFKCLHKRLALAHPLIAPPPLPPLHSARQQLDRYSPSFVAVRTMALHAFLDRVAKHPILTHSEDFRLFLTTPDDELDKIFKSENSALNLWGFGNALSYGSSESKPSNGARVKDPEFASAIDYLQSLQQKLTTLCALTTKLHKGIAGINTEYMCMKRVCDSWATQSTGTECRAAGAMSSGAWASARAHSARGPARHEALLPLMAAHASAHAAKIAQRDALHAAYVSGGNTTEDLHNRLEQASEALRSELSDWTPKTRAELKGLLLELADRQVASHTQALMGWDHALKLCSEADVAQIFKTVSKTAVLNLSPTKNRPDGTPTETERDLDDLEIDSIDSRDGVTELDNVLSDFSLEGVSRKPQNSSKNVQGNTSQGFEEVKLDCNDSLEINRGVDFNFAKNKEERSNFDELKVEANLKDRVEVTDSISGNNLESALKQMNLVEAKSFNEDLDKNSGKELQLQVDNHASSSCDEESCETKDGFLRDKNEVRTEKHLEVSQNAARLTDEEISDPLRDFSEVDLS